MPNFHSTKILGDLRVTGKTEAEQINADAISLDGQLTSTIATGTAPFIVSSTTRVNNLNVAKAGTADKVANSLTVSGGLKLTSGSDMYDGSAAKTISLDPKTLPGVSGHSFNVLSWDEDEKQLHKTNMMFDGNSSFSGINELSAYKITATEFVGELTGTASGNLTASDSLAAGNLSGTIPPTVLGNSTAYIGTTSVALNRSSGALSLTGVSIDGSSNSLKSNATTGVLKITGPANSSTRVMTVPNADFTVLYSGGALGTPSSGTLTNCTDAGSVKHALSAGNGLTFGSAVTYNGSTARTLSLDLRSPADPEVIESGTIMMLCGETGQESFLRTTAEIDASGRITAEFVGNLTGIADTALKLGTSTVGSTTLPIYLNAGVPTALTQENLCKGVFGTAAIGSASKPVYIAANGVVTAGNSIPSVSSTPTNGATTTAISSDWAFNNVKTSVPSGAVFTDTWNANSLNVAGYVAAPTSSNANKVWKTDASGNPAWRDDANTTYVEATSSVLGLVKIGYTTTAKNYAVQLSSGKMYVNVPWTDTNTTYSIKASTQTGGAGLDLDAGGSGSGTDTVIFKGSGATSVTYTDANTITISSTDNNNYLTGVTGSGNGTVTFTRSGSTPNLTWNASHNHNYLTSIDDRDVKPNNLSYNRVQTYFASLGGLTSTGDSGDYQDLLVLNTYNDSSGGDVNLLAFDKSEQKIRHYLADQAATTWGTPKTLAYSEDVANQLAGKLGTGDTAYDSARLNGKLANAYVLASTLSTEYATKNYVDNNFLTLSGGKTVTGIGNTIPLYLKRQTTTTDATIKETLVIQRTLSSGNGQNNIGAGISIKAPNTSGTAINVGMIGGRLATASGTTIGEIVLSPSYNNGDPFSRADVRIRATGASTVDMFINNSKVVTESRVPYKIEYYTQSAFAGITPETGVHYVVYEN